MVQAAGCAAAPEAGTSPRTAPGYALSLQDTAGSWKYGQSNSTWPLPPYFTINMWDFPPCYLKSWKYPQEKEEYPVTTLILA